MVFLDHVQNLHIHAEKTHKDSGAHCMNMLILYMVQKTHTGPYYRVQALFMYGVYSTKGPGHPGKNQRARDMLCAAHQRPESQ